MRKDEFTSRLFSCLHELPEEERKGVIEFYLEQLADRMDDGMTEEEALASLESPEDIAINVIKTYRESIPKAAAQTENLRPVEVAPSKNTNTVLIVIILLLTAIIWVPILIGLIFSILGLIVSILSILIASMAVGVSLFIYSIFSAGYGISLLGTSLSAAVFTLGTALVALGASALLVVISLMGAKLVTKGIKALIAYIQKKRKEKNPAKTTNSPAAPSSSPAAPFTNETELEVQTSDKSAVPADTGQKYPSMPLPPFCESKQDTQAPAPKSFWTRFAKPSFNQACANTSLIALMLLVVGGIICLVPVLKAGSLEALINETNLMGSESAFKASDVHTLEVTGDPTGNYLISNSSDEQIHVIWAGSSDPIDTQIQDGKLSLGKRYWGAQGVKYITKSSVLGLYADSLTTQRATPTQILVPKDWAGLIRTTGKVKIEKAEISTQIKPLDRYFIRFQIIDSVLHTGLTINSENISASNSVIDGDLVVKGLTDTYSTSLIDTKVGGKLELEGLGNVSFTDIEASELIVNLASGNIYGSLNGESSAIPTYLSARFYADQLDLAYNNPKDFDNNFKDNSARSKLDEFIPQQKRVNAFTKQQNSRSKRSEREQHYTTRVYGHLYLLDDEDLEGKQSEELVAEENHDTYSEESNREVHTYKPKLVVGDPATAKVRLVTENGSIQLAFVGDDKVLGYREDMGGATLIQQSIREGYYAINKGMVYNAVQVPLVLNLALKEAQEESAEQ